jgi:ribosomal protein S3
MMCKTISTYVGNGMKDSQKVDQDIAAWLQGNNEIRIISVSQVALGAHVVATTIIYE